MSSTSIQKGCNFKTLRLSVSSYKQNINNSDFESSFAKKVIEILSPAVTKSLPDGWQNIKSVSKAQEWIKDRNEESHFMSVQTLSDKQTVGYIFLNESKSDTELLDLRFGYLLSEKVWGKGLGTELILGLLNWCQEAGDIRSISGGVEKDNIASIKVLEKTGFSISVSDQPQDDVIFYEHVFLRS